MQTSDFRSADAPVEVDVSELAPGELKVVGWRGKPVWIMRRTKEQLEAVRKADDKVTDPRSQAPQQPEYARNEHRSIKPEVLVLVGICTHRGCTPQAKGAEAKGPLPRQGCQPRLLQAVVGWRARCRF